MITLRPYQQDLIDRTRKEMDRHRSILIQAPCGAGKTATTAEMLRLASMKGKRSWFICHRRELVKQSVMAFDNVGINVGICSAGFPEARKLPVQVCSIQTLARRFNRMIPPDFVVWDETSHIAAKSWSAIYNKLPKAYHVGITATPIRLDGAGLDTFFSSMVCGPTVKELIDAGYLSKYRLYAPSSVNTSGLHSRMGDFVQSELSALVDRPSITGDAIKHYIKLCQGKRAIVYAVSIEHSKHIVAQFIASGIPSEHVDGETESGARDASIERFKRGQTLILSNVDLFSEGTDVPAIEAVILLRPTQSLALYIQQSGRGLRRSVGKTECIILDHANCCRTHGLPDDDRVWSLKGIDKTKNNGEKTIGVKICSSCFSAQRPGQPKCQFCGHVFEIKYRKVDHQDGELTEVDIAAARRTRLVEQGKADGMDALVALGRKRGYRRPFLWAQHVLRSRKQKQEAKYA